MDLDKPAMEDRVGNKKETDLKKKLFEIINVLPNNSR